EQVADLGIRPHKRPLQFGQTDGAAADGVDQRDEWIGGRMIEHRIFRHSERCCGFCWYLAGSSSNFPYTSIIRLFDSTRAFSGEHEYGGAKVTEAALNKFPSREIPDTFETDPYRFLICADKFQTGYDQPLLHTMYV